MAEQAREQWGSRAGFLLAAIGSAVGLGNLWRFPYVAYDNGGGAFVIPYLIALLTAGIPLLILEYAIGHKFRGSPPVAFRRLNRRATAVGWWQVAICFVIAVYYAVIIAWSIRYAGYSLGQDWGSDPERFFNEEFLNIADSPGGFGGYTPGVLWPLVGVWLLIMVIVAVGIQKGVERANKVFVPLMTVLFGIMVVQALTLDGASTGLNALFTPDWQMLGEGKVWVAAYGQIFFTLSIGFGIMITYASYLRRRADLTGTAMVAGFANCALEIVAGIGVFAALGFMAVQSGVGVNEVATSGVGLAFIAFPQVISTMAAGAGLFGVLFFLSLAVAGIASQISIVQVLVSAVQDRTGLPRRTAALITVGVTALVSVLLFPTTQGLFLLDTADHFINQYGIVLAGFVMLIVVGWALRALPALEAHANSVSVIRLRAWWKICLGVVTPVVLGWMLWDSLRTELDENYGGYPTNYLLVYGWGVAIGAIVISVVLAMIPWRRGQTPDGDAAFRLESPAGQEKTAERDTTAEEGSGRR